MLSQFPGRFWLFWTEFNLIFNTYRGVFLVISSPVSCQGLSSSTRLVSMYIESSNAFITYFTNPESTNLHYFYFLEDYTVSFSVMINRWVSVVEFHDPTLGIGKVFGQESTVVKWNYQILGLHQVTVRQKLGVILVIKWFKNWSQQKMLFTKKVRLNWYSSMKFFYRKSGMIFDIENSLWKSKIGSFWRTATGWRPKIR